MKISEVILKLEEFQSQHGDINCVTSESDEYWGSIQNNIDEYNLTINNHAQPKGPKSGESEVCVQFGY